MTENSPIQRADVADAACHVMTYEEMIRADSLAPTEPAPARDCVDEAALFVESAEEPDIAVRCERVADTENLWSVKVRSPAGQVRPLPTGRDHGALDRTSLRAEMAARPRPAAYRPPWLAVDYFPRVAPRRVLTSATLVPGLGGRGIPSLTIHHQLSRAWPWCTVGRVFWGTGQRFARERSGTGVLVGRNLLLTASHLAPWGQPPGTWWMEFVPGYDYPTEPFGRSYVESFHGVSNTDDVTGVDYVICKLYTKLGDTCGWMGSQSFGDEDRYYDGEWTSVGYPETFVGGEWPAVEFAIGVRDIDDDGDGLELETVDFTDHGWSGGPLWGWIDNEPRVIGVCSGREKDALDPRRSVFAGGGAMVDLVRFGIANWS
jgi:hypothetical protein